MARIARGATPLFIGEHPLDGSLVGLVGHGGAAGVALGLGGFAVAVGQVGHLGVGTDDLSILGKLKALFGAAVSFQFRHGTFLLRIF